MLHLAVLIAHQASVVVRLTLGRLVEHIAIRSGQTGTQEGQKRERAYFLP